MGNILKLNALLLLKYSMVPNECVVYLGTLQLKLPASSISSLIFWETNFLCTMSQVACYYVRFGLVQVTFEKVSVR